MIPTKIIIVVALIILAGIALAIDVKFAFVNEKQNYSQSTCTINNCTVTQRQCCTYRFDRQTCNDCFDIYINYTLHDFNKTITKTQNTTLGDNNICKSKYCTCYFDTRNIKKTLSINQLVPVGGLTGIIVLTLFIIVLTFVLIGIIIQHTKNKIDKPLFEIV